MHRLFSLLLISLLAPIVQASPEVGERVSKVTAPSVDPVAAGVLGQLLLGLVLVLLLIGGLAWLMRRMGRAGGTLPGAIKVLTVQSLGTRERVVLLDVSGQQILVGVAPGQVRTLHTFAEGATMELPEANENLTFAQRLTQVIKERRPK